MNLIDSLIKEKWLKTPAIIEAFKKIKREDFMPARLAGGVEGQKVLAEIDEAMPIGRGQTISQPLTVAFMLEQLQPEPGDKILDIGSGSGWTTALLACIVSQKRNLKLQITNSKQGGKVIALEIIAELKEFGEKNASKYSFVEKGIAKFIKADGSLGYKKEAPYDKILASAFASNVPNPWKEQLKTGGRIVAPIGESIWVLEKRSKDEFKTTKYPGFIFVPLV